VLQEGALAARRDKRTTKTREPSAAARHLALQTEPSSADQFALCFLLRAPAAGDVLFQSAQSRVGAAGADVDICGED